MNVVCLQGRLARDPDLRYVTNGTSVCHFTIATPDRRKDKVTGEWVDDPAFPSITAWAATAERVGKMLRKGDSVTVQGRLKTETWEKDGKRHSRLTVNASMVRFDKPTPKGTGEFAMKTQTTDPTPQDDVPF